MTYYDEDHDKDRRLPCILLANLNCLSYKRSMVYKYLLDGEDPQIPQDDTESSGSSTPAPDSDDSDDSDGEDDNGSKDKAGSIAGGSSGGGTNAADQGSDNDGGNAANVGGAANVESDIPSTRFQQLHINHYGADFDDDTDDEDDDDDDDIPPLRLFAVVPTESIVHILATPSDRVKVHQTAIFPSLYKDTKAQVSNAVHRPLAADLELS